MAKSRDELQVSPEGLVNDVESAMLETCRFGFEQDEMLRHLRQPSVFEDANPNEIVVESLPALYAWCSGWDTDTDSMGGIGGRKSPITRKYQFFCQVQYIIPEIEAKSASKELRRIAWWLHKLIDSDLDLGGKVSGNPKMQEVEIFPKWRLVGDEVKSVSSVTIKVVYPINERSSISRR